MNAVDVEDAGGQDVAKRGSTAAEDFASLFSGSCPRCRCRRLGGE